MATTSDRKILYVGARLVGKETFLHTSTGELKDDKYMPVIPVSVPSTITLIFEKLPSPVTNKMDAVAEMLKMSAFTGNSQVKKFLNGLVDAAAKEIADAAAKAETRAAKVATKAAEPKAKKDSKIKNLREVIQPGAAAKSETTSPAS